MSSKPDAQAIAKNKDDSPEAFKKLLGMRQLAHAEAFRLSVGREAYDDPEAVERLLLELAATRKDQAALLNTIALQRQGIDEASKSTAALNDFLWSNMLSYKIAGRSATESHVEQNAEQDVLFEKVNRLHFELAQASGIARLLSAEASADEIATRCGRQFSQQQLAFGETLDNLEKGYSIRPVASTDGGIQFSVEGMERATAPATLGRLVSRQRAPKSALLGMIDMTFINSPAGPDFDFPDERMLDTLSDLLGIRGQPQQPTRRQDEDAEDAEAFQGLLSRRSSVYWSEKSGSELNVLRDDLADLTARAENGSFISEMLANAKSVERNQVDFPFQAQLREALEAPLASMNRKAQAIAIQDRQARTAAWFDGLAGHNSSELVQKVWTTRAGNLTSFSEIELICSNAKHIWQALEGQEALGLFSVRASRGLGLLLTGRDLPERAKKLLKKSHGFTDGAWRLLGRLPHGEDAPATKWAHAIGSAGTYEPTLKSEIETLLGPSHFSHRFLLTHEIDGLNGAAMERLVAERKKAIDQKVREITLERQARIIDLFGAILSTGSAKGAGIEKIDFLLAKIFEKKDSFIDQFLNEPKAPAGANISQGALGREAEAFRLKAPILLARMLEHFLSENQERSWESHGLVQDWLKDSEWGIWQDLPLNMTWADVNRRQKDWHDMIQRRERSEQELISWDCLIIPEANPQAGFSAAALTDGGMLWDEGKAMHHCVSTYANACENGDARIFSILKDNERFGTLEISLGEDGWQVSQFLGKCNANIEDDRANEFCAQICEKYQKAHFAKMAQRDPTEPPAPIGIHKKLLALRAENYPLDYLEGPAIADGRVPNR